MSFRLLEWFNTNQDEYTLLFTSGATAALKLIAESFQYGTGIYVYLCDNHTSVLGMREYAKSIKCLDIDEASDLFANNREHFMVDKSNNLFAYPAQSNFSGCKYPLDWIDKVHDGYLRKFSDGKWYCLLDAASYVSTNKLDLSQHKPDFVPISFYKIFGYPTGLGALLVKNTSTDVLNRSYFGGGTVNYIELRKKDVVIRRSNFHER